MRPVRMSVMSPADPRYLVGPVHGSYTRFYMKVDENHVPPRLRGASGDVRRCRGEQHDRKRTVEFETMFEWTNMSGFATRSRPPLGAFDDAHRVTNSSCRSVCSCTSTAAHGVHVGMV